MGCRCVGGVALALGVCAGCARVRETNMKIERIQGDAYACLKATPATHPPVPVLLLRLKHCSDTMSFQSSLTFMIRRVEFVITCFVIAI